jgi:hypothetical protein
LAPDLSRWEYNASKSFSMLKKVPDPFLKTKVIIGKRVSNQGSIQAYADAS